MSPEAIAIVGPTATGKTGLAIEVARALDGEIISLDSRQAYRGLEIGTAAPDAAEREAAPHHGVAIFGPEEVYGAGRFARFARAWSAEIGNRGRVLILAGGTGFFLRALLEPVFAEPPLDPLRRPALWRGLAPRPPAQIRRGAELLDPQLARRLARVDRQRAARTLELALFSGRPLTWWMAHGEPEAPGMSALVYALELPAIEHRARIARRTEELLARGWPDEVRALRDAGLADAPGFNAVGYRELLAWLEGEIDRAEAVDRINRATWAYARRQRTWFRHQLPGDTTRLDARSPVGQLARRIAADWHAATEGAEPPAAMAAERPGEGESP